MNLPVNQYEFTISGVSIGIIGSHFGPYVRKFPCDLAFFSLLRSRDDVLSLVDDSS